MTRKPITWTSKGDLSSSEWVCSLDGGTANIKSAISTSTRMIAIMRLLYVIKAQTVEPPYKGPV